MSRSKTDTGTVTFKSRNGDLTHAELLDALTEVIRHQTDVNLRIVDLFLEIREGKSEAFDMSALLTEVSNLLALNRILVGRYGEVVRNVDR